MGLLLICLDLKVLDVHLVNLHANLVIFLSNNFKAVENVRAKLCGCMLFLSHLTVETVFFWAMDCSIMIL